MAENLKELIEKIQQEGIKAAEEKARAIEEEAQKQAKIIVDKARKEAARLLEEAKEKTGQLQQASLMSLQHACRDLLLSLRKEINRMLEKLITRRVREALSPQELTKVIAMLIKEYAGKEKEDIIIGLRKKDLQALEKDFLGELKEEARKGIVLKADDEIQGGFIISFDSGKSHFDFTDKALAEYLASYLDPKLSRILEEEASEENKPFDSSPA